jgi:hypothetical protein
MRSAAPPQTDERFPTLSLRLQGVLPISAHISQHAYEIWSGIEAQLIMGVRLSSSSTKRALRHIV